MTLGVFLRGSVCSDGAGARSQAFGAASDSSEPEVVCERERTFIVL